MGLGGLAGLAAALPTVHATTQFTFDGFGTNNIGIATLPDFGDNVTTASTNYVVSLGIEAVMGTPGITTEWGIGYETYANWDGRSGVAQLDFGAAPTIDLTLTPAAPFGVLLTSFDLDEWGGGGDVSVTWSVTGATQGILATGTWTHGEPGGRDTIFTGLTESSSIAGEAITLRFTLNSGAPSYVALDNLVFDQVPEPAVLGLGVLGLGALALRRRKP
jgi:hypothetical protein